MKLKADPDARVSVHLTDTITKSDCTGNAGISSQCGLGTLTMMIHPQKLKLIRLDWPDSWQSMKWQSNRGK